jgi:hypothetical protein
VLDDDVTWQDELEQPAELKPEYTWEQISDVNVASDVPDATVKLLVFDTGEGAGMVTQYSPGQLHDIELPYAVHVSE